MSPIRRLFLAGFTSVALSACASVPMTPASQAPAYQSSFSESQRVFGPYDLDAIAQAPQKNMVSISFDKPASEVFLPLLTQVDLYDASIVDVSFDNSQSQTPGELGVGSVRICTFDDGKKLFEPIVVYQPDAFYAYTTDRERSTKSLPIKDVLLFYAFEEKSDNTSLVTVRAHYNPGNAFVAPVVGIAFGRALKQTFSSAAQTFGGRLVDPGA